MSELLAVKETKRPKALSIPVAERAESGGRSIEARQVKAHGISFIAVWRFRSSWGERPPLQLRGPPFGLLAFGGFLFSGGGMKNGVNDGQKVKLYRCILIGYPLRLSASWSSTFAFFLILYGLFLGCDLGLLLLSLCLLFAFLFICLYLRIACSLFGDSLPLSHGG